MIQISSLFHHRQCMEDRYSVHQYTHQILQEHHRNEHSYKCLYPRLILLLKVCYLRENSVYQTAYAVPKRQLISTAIKTLKNIYLGGN